MILLPGSGHIGSREYNSSDGGLIAWQIAVHRQHAPAFIVYRVIRPFYGEAFHLLDETVADVLTLDRQMRSSSSYTGPIELITMVECGANLEETTSVYNQFGHDWKHRSHPI